MKYLILLSILFFVSEFALMLTRRSKKVDVAKRSDKGSLILLWVTIPLSFTFGFVFGNYNLWSLTNYIVAGLGIVFIVVGLVIRWVAILQLKRSFTVDVSIVTNHKLKTDGVYKFVRHPSYFGLLLIMMGFGLAMNTVGSFLIISAPMILVIYYRIRVEEQALIAEFKEIYIDYSSKTKMLIPWLI